MVEDMAAGIVVDRRVALEAQESSPLLLPLTAHLSSWGYLIVASTDRCTVSRLLAGGGENRRSYAIPIMDPDHEYLVLRAWCEVGHDYLVTYVDLSVIRQI